MLRKKILEILNKLKVFDLFDEYTKQRIADDIVREVSSYDVLEKKLTAELHRIELDKWIKGEEINRDPGNEFIFEWIAKHGESFHTEFENSDCRICGKVSTCANVPKFFCDRYAPDLPPTTPFLIKKILQMFGNGFTKEDIINHYGCQE
jgi:hypothetical protein